MVVQINNSKEEDLSEPFEEEPEELLEEEDFGSPPEELLKKWEEDEEQLEDELHTEYLIQQINEFCEMHDIRNYTIRDSLVVDVQGNVDISNAQLTRIPFQFGFVMGNFNCSDNHLTSLKGSPKECMCFYCYNNQLTTLEYAPEIVSHTLNCMNNRITNFTGINIEILHTFDCQDNPLEIENLDLSGITMKSPHNSNEDIIFTTEEALPELPEFFQVDDIYAENYDPYEDTYSVDYSQVIGVQRYMQVPIEIMKSYLAAKLMEKNLPEKTLINSGKKMKV